MNEKRVSVPARTIALFIIATIAVVTVVLSLGAGRDPLDILAYLGFVACITYFCFR